MGHLSHTLHNSRVYRGVAGISRPASAASTAAADDVRARNDAAQRALNGIRIVSRREVCLTRSPYFVLNIYRTPVLPVKL